MFTVTRQLQWPEGRKVVEVSCGTLDFCNPDALVAKYEGEMQTYSDPIEAVKVAISICEKWKEDSGEEIEIGVGNTAGFTIPFEVSTYEEAKEWAKKVREKLPKCACCRNPLDETSSYFLPFSVYICHDDDGEITEREMLEENDDERYCSLRCAQKRSMTWVERDQKWYTYEEAVEKGYR